MIECIKFKPYQSGCLIGFADFKIHKWGAVIPGCSVYEKNGGKWVNLPSKEYLNDKGKKKFSPFLRFKDDNVYKAFSRGLKEALDKYTEKNNEAFVEREFASSVEDEPVPF